MVLKDVDALEAFFYKTPPQYDAESYDAGVREVLTRLDGLPVVESEPVQHGHWILKHGGTAVCTNCRHTTLNVWDYDFSANYCPHCGAKMSII